MSDDGGPAFPCTVAIQSVAETDDAGKPKLTHNLVTSSRMSLRSWFAGKAFGDIFSAMAARRHEAGYSDRGAINEATDLALYAADEMIARLNESPRGPHEAVRE